MKRIALLLSCLFALGGSLYAETYHSVKVSELDFGAESEAVKAAFEIQAQSSYGSPAVNVRCAVECYAASPRPADGNRGLSNQGGVELVFKLETDEPLEGFIDLRVEDVGGNGMELKGFPFTFTPGAESVSTKERFEEVRGLQSGWLAMGHLPGSSWFKHLSRSSEAEAGNRNWQGDGLEQSFGIFSGGRAISENLALDRELILSAGKDGTTVPLSEIKGITVPAIDWKSRLPEGEVAVDALSLSIPEDQHAVFAKNLPDLLALIDRAETQLMPAAQAYSVRSPFRTLATRYRAQMGLDVPAIAARLLPAKSVAITGGDPFFPQGTDVAFVMESDTPELLYLALLKTIQGKAAKAGAVVTVEKGDGYDYTSFQTADRSFSSHVWRMGDVIAVSNSKMQIRQLIAVAKKEKPALGSTDEYRFFRNRYPLADDESAFVFLSDATIRRWGGPELRIAASRRTRALAALGKLTSQALSGEDVTDDYAPLIGDTLWENGRMKSPVYGSLGFVTPSSELGIESATVPEKEAYERWRNGYENGWAQAFDPIAIRIRSKGDSISFDLSVMPLTVDSDFSEFVALCGKAELGEKARWVPGGSMLHAAIALDTKGETFRKYDKQIIEFLPGLDVNPLGWMTGSVSVVLEKSMFWDADADGDFYRFARTPLLLRIGSSSRLKLALFMTAIRSAVETSAPDSVKWETRKNGGKSYVVITGNEMGSDFHIYYATTSSALLITLREDALLRAMDRETHKLSAEETESLPAPTQLMLDSSPMFLAELPGVFDLGDPLERIREESWKALPILNEWHRRFAGKDPLAVQLLHYGEDIFCPGGKGYRWNAGAMTMESVAYGFPANPKAEPAEMPGIMDFPNVATALKFQDDGLRATLALGQQPKRLSIPEVKAGDGEVIATAMELSPLKEGMVLSYKGTKWGTSSTLKLTTKDIVRNGEKVSFKTVSEGKDDGEEPFGFTNHYVLDKGLRMTAINDGEGGGADYTEPYLQLPETLIAGEIIHGASKGRTTWKNEDGSPVEEDYAGGHEIRIIGKEDIEVPAGKFPGSIRIEVVGEMIFGGRFRNDKYIMWYHPKVGMVKFEYLEGQDSIMELQEVSMPESE